MEQREALRLALVERAKEARKNSYCPYSGFAVGAALLGSDGKGYTGCNIESAAFGATLCAERGAICNAFAQGCRSFVRGAVISSGDGYCTPCGICRQLLFEFSDHLVMLCCRNDGAYLALTAEELLPHGFQSETME